MRMSVHLLFRLWLFAGFFPALIHPLLVAVLANLYLAGPEQALALRMTEGALAVRYGQKEHTGSAQGGRSVGAFGAVGALFA